MTVLYSSISVIQKIYRQNQHKGSLGMIGLHTGDFDRLRKEVARRWLQPHEWARQNHEPSDWGAAFFYVCTRMFRHFKKCHEFAYENAFIGILPANQLEMTSKVYADIELGVKNFWHIPLIVDTHNNKRMFRSTMLQHSGAIDAVARALLATTNQCTFAELPKIYQNIVGDDVDLRRGALERSKQFLKANKPVTTIDKPVQPPDGRTRFIAALPSMHPSMHAEPANSPAKLVLGGTSSNVSKPVNPLQKFLRNCKIDATENSITFPAEPDGDTFSSLQEKAQTAIVFIDDGTVDHDVDGNLHRHNLQDYSIKLVYHYDATHKKWFCASNTRRTFSLSEYQVSNLQEGIGLLVSCQLHYQQQASSAQNHVPNRACRPVNVVQEHEMGVLRRNLSMKNQNQLSADGMNFVNDDEMQAYFNLNTEMTLLGGEVIHGLRLQNLPVFCKMPEAIQFLFPQMPNHQASKTARSMATGSNICIYRDETDDGQPAQNWRRRIANPQDQARVDVNLQREEKNLRSGVYNIEVTRNAKTSIHRFFYLNPDELSLKWVQPDLLEPVMELQQPSKRPDLGLQLRRFAFDTQSKTAQCSDVFLRMNPKAKTGYKGRWWVKLAPKEALFVDQNGNRRIEKVNQDTFALDGTLFQSGAKILLSGAASHVTLMMVNQKLERVGNPLKLSMPKCGRLSVSSYLLYNAVEHNGYKIPAASQKKSARQEAQRETQRVTIFVKWDNETQMQKVL